MYSDRKKIYEKIESNRNSKVLVYVTGDRPGLETQIHPEVVDYFSDHLDAIGIQKKITLILYSRGGHTLAAWNIVNLIKLFCDELEVIIPSKAHSAATLISLAANKIIMTKQATLGPIDPSVNGPLNPQVPGAPINARIPISVESVAGYFDLARSELKINSKRELSNIFINLSNQVHPLALGNVYRARTQIQMLADKLLSHHMKDKNNKEKIISFICSESGSHDYTINRREAKNELGLPVEKPSEELYKIIKEVFNDFRNELELNNSFNPNILLGNNPQISYTLKRGLIESIDGGAHHFNTEGILAKLQNPQTGMIDIINNITFEGWKNV